MPVAATFFLGLFVVAGLGVAGFGVRTVLRDRATLNWPQVPGQITQASVFTNSDADGDSYKPSLTYRYMVNGRECTGQRISYGVDRISSGGRFAWKYTEKYRVGNDVRVAYQPGEPAISVLETGVTKRSFCTMVFGLGFAFFGAWFLLLVWLMES